MRATTEVVIILGIALLLLAVIMVLLVVARRLENDEERHVFESEKKRLLGVVKGQEYSGVLRIAPDVCLAMRQVLKPESPIKKVLERIIRGLDLEKKYARQLRSRSSIKRKEAAVCLGLIGTDSARMVLEDALLKEKSDSVKIYIANALSDIGHEESIAPLVGSLLNAHRWYRSRVNMLICGFAQAFDEYALHLRESKRLEIKELMVAFAAEYPSKRTRDYLVRLIENEKQDAAELFDLTEKKACVTCYHASTGVNWGFCVCRFRGDVHPLCTCSKYRPVPALVDCRADYPRLVGEAARVLARFFPGILDDEAYLRSENIEVRRAAISALARFSVPDNLRRLLTYLTDDEVYRFAVSAASEMVEKEPRFLSILIRDFEREENPVRKKRMAEILAIRMQYLIRQLLTGKKKAAAAVIKELLLLGHTSEVIEFLHRNRNLDLENELVGIIREVAKASDELAHLFARHLPERVAKKCGLAALPEPKPQEPAPPDRPLMIGVYSIIVLAVALVPLMYLVRHSDLVLTASWRTQLEVLVIDFNYFLAYYCIAINSVYLLLLGISLLYVREQERLWKIKTDTFLFKKNMLPSVSIIAPAFNEEKTIIESANSLLNLKYPDYEVIIVNDGSKDRTLEVLIDYFDLARVDYVFEARLQTKPVRGVYMNRAIPKLIVVDKENGGKADSLNAGINVSRKEYFCGIDADSLLESDALLKLASMVIDQDVEVPALGGNVFPVNGCVVERGKVAEVRIPQNRLAILQTLEYLRAFMAGRLGWAKTGSLMIISGAFGLFRKQRIIDIGGYLTRTERYAKDTVGEDMELVVRINRLMREIGKRYRVCYSFNANCWTEVPEDVRSLKRQRYRWHRGLLEILSFHRKMIFNPSYGRVGLVAMPYFLIFEAFGPLIEAEGYLAVVAASVLNILNVKIAVLLFAANVLMGVVISLSALFIALRNLMYLRWKDIAVLIWYALAENFGPRQFMSVWRAAATVNMLKKPTGWGKAERRGFALEPNPTDR